jgi:hypothetical protein
MRARPTLLPRRPAPSGEFFPVFACSQFKYLRVVLNCNIDLNGWFLRMMKAMFIDSASG